MDSLTKILTALFSWPIVVLILALVFSKQLRQFFELFLCRNASLKLPGNIELSLRDLQEHDHVTPVVDEDKNFSLAVSKIIATLPDKSPESIRKALEDILSDYRKADLRLYLKTVSYQLLAWLFTHRSGEPFGIADLLVAERIQIEKDGKLIGAYCIHSGYEKEAIAAEFRRNYWNLKHYGIIEDVSDKQVRMNSNKVVQVTLADAMDEVCRTESERTAINSFIEHFLKEPSVVPKKLDTQPCGVG